MMRRLHAGVLLVSIIFAAECARVHVSSRAATTTQAASPDAAHSDAPIRVTLAAAPPAFVTRDDEGARLWTATQEFYARRNFEPAWFEDGEPRREIAALAEAIHSADDDGLDPEIYSATLLDQRKSVWAGRGSLGADEISDADAWLTYVYMTFASDLADGASDVARAEGSWKIKSDTFDPLAHLEAAVRENNVSRSLASLTPADRDYRALRQALAQYRTQAAKGGWPAVPAAMKLKPGQQSADVAALARRLEASGDYHGAMPGDDAPAAYTADLQEAVKAFQRRHGLADDGAVGAAAVAELNVPIGARIRQIALNMERWRWLPRNRGDRHIIVNIPEMRLEVRDHGSVPVSMRVVVGKHDTPTPIFNEDMKYLVFAPYWNIPEDIAKKETLPRAIKDPGFLDRSNMEVVDPSGRAVDPASIDLTNPGKYRLRQRPGTSNSLGLVKFMLPNQYNVYLHDTPADSLFARASRSFSHGCVRLEEPMKLAQYVLGDQPDWTEERIQEAMHSASERTVKLTAPLPVYIGYWTARVAEGGVVQFRKDVYGIDVRIMAALVDREERMKQSAAAAMLAINATQGN